MPQHAPQLRVDGDRCRRQPLLHLPLPVPGQADRPGAKPPVLLLRQELGQPQRTPVSSPVTALLDSICLGAVRATCIMHAEQHLACRGCVERCACCGLHMLPTCPAALTRPLCWCAGPRPSASRRCGRWAMTQASRSPSSVRFAAHSACLLPFLRRQGIQAPPFRAAEQPSTGYHQLHVALVRCR
jgi:hypothetical protein